MQKYDRLADIFSIYNSITVEFDKKSLVIAHNYTDSQAVTVRPVFYAKHPEHEIQCIHFHFDEYMLVMEHIVRCPDNGAYYIASKCDVEYQKDCKAELLFMGFFPQLPICKFENKWKTGDSQIVTAQYDDVPIVLGEIKGYENYAVFEPDMFGQMEFDDGTEPFQFWSYAYMDGKASLYGSYALQGYPQVQYCIALNADLQEVNVASDHKEIDGWWLESQSLKKVYDLMDKAAGTKAYSYDLTTFVHFRKTMYYLSKVSGHSFSMICDRTSDYLASCEHYPCNDLVEDEIASLTADERARCEDPAACLLNLMDKHHFSKGSKRVKKILKLLGL